jgi:hypothetical protein
MPPCPAHSGLSTALKPLQRRGGHVARRCVTQPCEAAAGERVATATEDDEESLSLSAKVKGVQPTALAVRTTVRTTTTHSRLSPYPSSWGPLSHSRGIDFHAILARLTAPLRRARSWGRVQTPLHHPSLLQRSASVCCTPTAERSTLQIPRTHLAPSRRSAAVERAVRGERARWQERGWCAEPARFGSCSNGAMPPACRSKR